MPLSPFPCEAFVTGHCLASSNQRGANSVTVAPGAHEIRAADAGRFKSRISRKLFGG